MTETITDDALSKVAGRPVDSTQAVHYSPKLIEAIAVRFPVDAIVDLLVSLVNAEIITKGGHRIADNRTRLAAATLMLNYLVGRPVERQEIVTVNVDADSEAGMMDRLAKSPALRASFRKILDAAEAPVIEG